MGLLSRFVGTKYNDQQLVDHIEKAIAIDPLVVDTTSVTVSSAKGVVTLVGGVRRAQEKDRLEGVVRSALRNANLKFERIDNQITVR